MRVLHVMAGAASGGAETMMADGVEALAAAGVTQAALIRDNSPSRLTTLKLAQVETVTDRFSKLWPWGTKFKLAKLAQGFKPDVIHHWMGRAGQVALPRYQARNLGWYGGYYKLSRFTRCDWHAGVTPDIAAHIVAEGAAADRVVTLRTYANLCQPAPPVTRESLSTPDNVPVVLSLARLHPKKGLDVLLDALVGLPDVYLWMAGDGPLEADLKSQATRLGLDERVRFLGWRTDRGALLAACDVVAFPSRYEPFGTVTVEAWAARKPLVVADAAGPKATVTPNVNAVLVPKDNVAALRDGLARALTDQSFAANLVEAGWQAYQQGYTAEAFSKAACMLYKRIAARALTFT
jgi:glycosyltransferase involved in cell wall biosynthesis